MTLKRLVSFRRSFIQPQKLLRGFIVRRGKRHLKLNLVFYRRSIYSWFLLEKMTISTIISCTEYSSLLARRAMSWSLNPSEPPSYCPSTRPYPDEKGGVPSLRTRVLLFSPTIFRVKEEGLSGQYNLVRRKSPFSPAHLSSFLTNLRKVFFLL